MRNRNTGCRSKFIKILTMARNQSNSPGESYECCAFCLIAQNIDEEVTIMKQDEELVCFKDIYPAAPHHYLVIPREHIESCRSLNKYNMNLVKKMAKMGKEVLREKGITDIKDVRLGFHQPPFISVKHLHLHVLAPASKISDCMLYKFTPGTDRFIIEESLRKCLEKVSPKANQNCVNLF